MGIRDKLFGKERTAAHAAVVDAPCPHTTLLPRWDSAADIGKADKASSYTCDTCKQAFTVEAAQALRATEAERVQRELQV